jgi:hypothetical protein
MNSSTWKLVDRFKEPSSWAALASGAAMIGVIIPPGYMQAISFVGSGICVLLGVILKESPNAQNPPSPPAA